VSRAGPIEPYLAAVTAGLPGPARSHAAIVAELRSGLMDATDAYRSAGLPPAQAAGAAVKDFGDPGQVADGFRAEIAAGQARRVSITLLAAGPVVGLLWIAATVASHGARSWQWLDQSPALLRAGACLAVAVIAAQVAAVLLGVAATGRLTRWLPVRPRRAPTAAVVAGLGAAGVDVIVLSLLAEQVATAAWQLSPVPIAVAAAASLARMLLATRAACRCLAMRAALA
jgi:hypothetical protein